MISLRGDRRAIEVSIHHEVLRVEPWGADSLRVRVGQHGIVEDVPGALLPPKPTEPVIDIADGVGRISNGELTAIVEERTGDTGPYSLIRFVRTSSGAELLAEQRAHFWWPGARLFQPQGNGYHRLEQRFAGYEGEKLFGLGQHTHGRLNQKNLVLDLVQRNGEVSIPFLLSDRGYGFLWNLPAVGRVELADNGTRWVADTARQIDYWITTGDNPADILSHYADATGRPPMLPEWASGFWQSKLRYRDQEELLSVAREYVRRDLPLSVIVGRLLPLDPPRRLAVRPGGLARPGGMVRELADLGVQLMVSVWPSVNPMSENYRELTERGLLVASEHGVPFHAPWLDKGFTVPMPVAFYDPTNPAAREFVWSTIKANYFDLGVRAFWLDGCEPEIQPGHPQNLRFHDGAGAEVVNSYPAQNARTFYEGTAQGADEDEVVLLCRSAWAGSQRYGAAVWSGDIGPTWESLRAQVRAGLNIGLSGIPWWTTDIGGFNGGDPDSDEYRELVVRWFQYGALCPLFRLHGFRAPQREFGPDMTGGPNEVWSYGEQAYGLIEQSLRLRERLRPYLMRQMRIAHETGLPPMRPLFVDFPDDATAWATEDQFLLGPDLLVAPVLAAGARSRLVYLPAGARWRDPWTGTTHEGGQTIDAAAPLDRIPLFLRDEASIPLLE